VVKALCFPQLRPGFKPGSGHVDKSIYIGSSSPYESNRASPTGGRRPLPFKKDLMGLSLSYIPDIY
jgi:hypothetical protein